MGDSSTTKAGVSSLSKAELLWLFKGVLLGNFAVISISYSEETAHVFLTCSRSFDGHVGFHLLALRTKFNDPPMKSRSSFKAKNEQKPLVLPASFTEVDVQHESRQCGFLPDCAKRSREDAIMWPYVPPEL